MSDGGARMGKRNRMFRGGAAVACASLIAAISACTGDDSGSGGDDGVGGGSSSGSGYSSSGVSVGGSSSSGSGGSSGSGSGSSSSSGSSGSTDGGVGASDDAGSDGSSSSDGGSAVGSGSDGGTVAAHDATVADGGSGVDATLADAGSAAADGGKVQLMWCPFLDSDWAILPDAGESICATQTPPNGTCPDRADGWANPGPGIAGDFLNLLYADCRVEAMGDSPVLTADDVNNYWNQTEYFTLAFFGCPNPTQSAGPFGGFGLIPAPLLGHAFTTADVALLEQMYVESVVQALSDNGSPPLTATQMTELQAALDTWGASVGATSSSVYSYADPATCAPDGGPVVDAGSAGPSDAGHDGESDAARDGESDAAPDREGDADNEGSTDAGGG